MYTMLRIKNRLLLYACLILPCHFSGQSIGCSISCQYSKLLGNTFPIGVGVQFKTPLNNKLSLVLYANHGGAHRLGWKGNYMTKFRSYNADIGILYTIVQSGQWRFGIGLGGGYNISDEQHFNIKDRMSDWDSYKFVCADLIGNIEYALSEHWRMNSSMLPNYMFRLPNEVSGTSEAQVDQISCTLLVGVSYLFRTFK